MNYQLFILLLTALMMVFSPLSSATPTTDSTGTIRGTIQTASTGTPIPGANVAVRTASDSTLVGGAATDSSGHFVVDDLPLGTYDVVASFVGYAPESRRVALTQAQPTRMLNAFRLSQMTAQMRGVLVSADKAFMTTEGNKTVYNIEQAQVALAGKSVVDVLQELPSIQIDFDGGIRLRGSENVPLHINGEPAPMEGKALVQYLRSLSAGDVERVEVNTNPSARHDAEGTAGIINIVLDRADDPGWNGDLTASGGTGPRFSGSGNLGYKQDPWTINGSYSYRRVGQEMTQDLFRRSRDAPPTVLLDQSASEDRTFGGHGFSAQVDYAPTSNTTLSLTSAGIARGNDRTRTVAYREGSAADGASSSNREVDNDHRHLHLDERLSATRQFGSERHELSAAVRYQMTSQRQSFYARKALPSSPQEQGRNDEIEHDASAKVDYTRPVGPWTIETGYKGSARHLNQEYDVDRFDAAAGRFESLPERGSAFTFEEQVHAAYGTLQREIGPAEAEAGVRFEHTHTTVDPSGKVPDDNRYADVYPSASLTYAPSRARRLSLSYSKRVNRPSAHQLSSFGALSDPHLHFVGNPNLEPEQVHKIELTLMQHAGPATITLSPYAQRTVNTIDWQTSVRSDSLTVRSFDNYDASTSFGAELSSSLRLGRAVQVRLNGNAYRMKTRGGSLQSGLTRDAFAVSGRANATWTLRPGLRLQASQYYRSSINTGLGRIDALLRTEAALEQSLWNDRATLGLRLRDPFDTSDVGLQKRNSSFYERMINDWNGRTLSLSFSYRFGETDAQQTRNRPPSDGDNISPIGGG